MRTLHTLTMTVALLIGWVTCALTTACADSSTLQWRSSVHHSPIQWVKTDALKLDSQQERKMGLEGSGSQSAVYGTVQFQATSNLAAGTKLYVFFSKDAADSAEVETFLTSNKPDSWRQATTQSQWGQILKTQDNFLEITIGQGGLVLFFLDGYRSPQFKSFRLLTITDANGQILDRLMAGG